MTNQLPPAEAAYESYVAMCSRIDVQPADVETWWRINRNISPCGTVNRTKGRGDDE